MCFIRSESWVCAVIERIAIISIYSLCPSVIPEFKKVLRRVLTLLLHPTPTESGFYLIVNVVVVNVVVVVKKCSSN